MKTLLVILSMFAFVFCTFADGTTVYEPPEGYDNALVFGVIADYADLGLEEGDIIVDADYNPATGNLVVAVSKTEFGAGDPDGIILIVDPEYLSVIHTITGAYDDGGHGFGLDGVRVTEDGVILAVNTVGAVFLVGTEDDSEADGRHLHGPVYTDNDGVQRYGGGRNFDVIGNYNDGECVFVSGRGRRVRLSQNSPEDVDDFEEIRDYDLIEFPSGYTMGVVLAQDGSMLYAYGGDGIRAYSGDIETGYSFDSEATDALPGFGFENFIGGNYDAGIIALGKTGSDVLEDPDYGYIYTRVVFRNIHDGSPIGTGNATEGAWGSLDEGEYWEAGDEDNPFPGMYVETHWPAHNSDAGGIALIPEKQRAYLAVPGGIVQFRSPTDIPYEPKPPFEKRWAVMADENVWFADDNGTHSAAMNPVTGNVLVAAWEDEPGLKVLAHEDGQLKGELNTDGRVPRTVEALPSGKIIAAVNGATEIMVWDEEEIDGAAPEVVDHTATISSGRTIASVENDAGEIIVLTGDARAGDFLKYTFDGSTWSATEVVTNAYGNASSIAVLEDGSIIAKWAWEYAEGTEAGDDGASFAYLNPDGTVDEEVTGFFEYADGLASLDNLLMSNVVIDDEENRYIAVANYTPDFSEAIGWVDFPLNVHDYVGIWNLDTGEEIASIVVPELFVNDAIQADGTVTLALSTAGTVHVDPGRRFFVTTAIQNNNIGLFTSHPEQLTVEDWMLFEY